MKLDTKTKTILRDTQKRRAWVIYQHKQRGESLASIAVAAGVAKQQTQKAMSAPYPRMEKVIADALWMMPQDLFPDRYTSDGLPRPRRHHKKAGVSTPNSNTRCFFLRFFLVGVVCFVSLFV